MTDIDTLPRRATMLRPWQATGTLAIDRLIVWALRDQQAGDPASGLFALEAESEGLAVQRWSTDGTAAVERIAAMGCQVDGGGGTRIDVTHPVADLVARLVMGLPDDARHLVTDCAHLAGGPEGWAKPARWLTPERWEEPEAKAMWTYREKRLDQHCPLVRVSSAETVEWHRARHLLWWDTLDQLVWGLATRALGFAVLPPSVPREPWGEGA